MPALTHIRMTYNNVYVVDGAGGRVLIDTGPDYQGARELLDEALGERLPQVVLATHGHSDHAGLGAWWQAKGIDVVAGAADVHLTQHPHMVQQAEFDAMARFVRECGAPEHVEKDALAGLERRRAWALSTESSSDYPPATRSTRWPTGLRYEPFVPARPISEDVTILGVEVLQCPGHTPGNLVAVVSDEGWLFSGDQLLPDITPTPGIQFVPSEVGFARFPSLPAFEASLGALQQRRFVRCYPGHGEPFDDVNERIEANLSGIQARTERVLAELVERGPGTVYDVADRLYPRAVVRRFWQIIATVQGHLDILVGQQRIVRREHTYEVVR